MRIHLLSCFMVLVFTPIYSTSETTVVELDTEPTIIEDVRSDDNILSEERINHLLQPAVEVEEDESDFALSKKSQVKAKKHKIKNQKINRFFPSLFTPKEGGVEVTGTN